MKVTETLQRADVLGAAWYQAQTARQQRPRLGPGDIQVAEVYEGESRRWWAFEVMRPGYAQALAATGGIIVPLLGLLTGVMVLYVETSTLEALAAKVALGLAVSALSVCLFLFYLYIGTETNWLDEHRIERAGEGVRAGASILILIGGLSGLPILSLGIVFGAAFLVALLGLLSD